MAPVVAFTTDELLRFDPLTHRDSSLFQTGRRGRCVLSNDDRASEKHSEREDLCVVVFHIRIKRRTQLMSSCEGIPTLFITRCER